MIESSTIYCNRRVISDLLHHGHHALNREQDEAVDVARKPEAANQEHDDDEDRLRDAGLRVRLRVRPQIEDELQIRVRAEAREQLLGLSRPQVTRTQLVVA